MPLVWNWNWMFQLLLLNDFLANNIEEQFVFRDFNMLPRHSRGTLLINFPCIIEPGNGTRGNRGGGGELRGPLRWGEDCAHAPGVGYTVEWMSFIPSGAVHIVSAAWRGHHPLSGIVYFLDRDLAVMYGCGFARYASHTRPSVR